MTPREFHNIVRRELARLYPGYQPEDYERLAAKCAESFAAWARGHMIGAKKARNVRLTDVPQPRPAYLVKVLFDSMGVVKESLVRWTDTRRSEPPKPEATP